MLKEKRLFVLKQNADMKDLSKEVDNGFASSLTFSCVLEVNMKNRPETIESGKFKQTETEGKSERDLLT